jgi:uncharacterized protein YaaQ
MRDAGYGRANNSRIPHPASRVPKGSLMKLIIAIVQDEDSDALSSALIQVGFRLTRIGSTGSFLRVGNTSLLIGVADEDVPRVLAIVEQTCHRRMQLVVPYSPELDAGLPYVPEPYEVEVGGAVVFVHHVERFERL